MVGTATIEAGISIGEIRARCRRLASSEHGLSLIVIDYLQLTYPLNLSVDTNFNKIAEENIKKVKELAEHYNIPIILVTMLNDNEKKEIEQKKIIKDNSDIVMEIKRQKDNSQIKITNSKNKTEIINCKFNKNSCEFIEVK